MGFRFRKSYNLGPLRVNLSKSGVGYSVGTKGFRATKKTGGGYRTTASIPGTGISYTKDYGHSAKGASNNRSDGKYAAPNNSNTPAPSGGSSAPPKSKLTEFLLCLFLGCFGAHRFYMRKFGTAVLYLCTIGCFGIGWLVDVVKLAIGIFANGGTKKEKAISSTCIVCVLLLAACGNGQAKVPDPAQTEPTQIVTEAVETTTLPATEPATVPSETAPAIAEAVETTVPETAPAETEVSTTEAVITEPETEPVATEPEEEMVWIPTGGGTKYHSRSSCSNMDNPSLVPLSEAIARGFTACKRCH